MVIAYHIVMGFYGFWLPNDPRGSWSTYVGSRALYQFGPATKVHTKRSLAHDPHDHEARLAAKRALKHPPVVLNGQQARAVARGFAAYVSRRDVPVHACAIMPDHVHIVVARSGLRAEQVVIQLKGAATRALIGEGCHPCAARASFDGRVASLWARGQWIVYLNSEAAVCNAIRYVDLNPVREGMKRQRWNFVKTLT